MSCASKLLTQNIVADCTNVKKGGSEQKVWVVNRSYIENVTQVDNKVTAFDIATGEVLNTISVAEKGFSAKSTFVPAADGYPRGYTQGVAFKDFGKTAAELLNVDNADDLVFIAENRDKDIAGDGDFIMLGMVHGLFKSSDAFDSNADRGSRVLEYASDEDSIEPYSVVVLDAGSNASTLALLVGLETNVI